MLKHTFYIVLFFILLTRLIQAKEMEKVTLKNNAQVTTYQIDSNVKIHDYFKTFVSAYIIENKDSITVVDTLFSEEEGQELLDYANSLNKSIDKVIITHSHGDHVKGLNAFKSYPIYALKGTIEDIKKEIGKYFNFKIIKDNSSIEASNLSYKAYNMKKAHIADHLVLYNTKLNYIITGDLVSANFNKAGLIIIDFDAFKTALNNIKNTTNKDTVFLTFHSGIGTQSAVNNSIKYINKATEITKTVKTPQEYMEQIHKYYPELRTDALQVERLEGNAIFKK